MTYKFKYVGATVKEPNVVQGKGRPIRPERWIYPDPIQRDQYYALLKHRAQARYRQESHSLTEEQWFDLWREEWHNRGRKAHNSCLCQIEIGLGWHYSNVEVVPRSEYLKRSAEYRARKRANND